MRKLLSEVDILGIAAMARRGLYYRRLLSSRAPMQDSQNYKFKTVTTYTNTFPHRHLAATIIEHLFRLQTWRILACPTSIGRIFAFSSEYEKKLLSLSNQRAVKLECCSDLFSSLDNIEGWNEVLKATTTISSEWVLQQYKISTRVLVLAQLSTSNTLSNQPTT